MRAGCHVIVIGAGLAGLAAARRLRERECQVTLLDRSDRAGGRASSEEREGSASIPAPTRSAPPTGICSG
jgi:phytoene dehydrogenase-like protein